MKLPIALSFCGLLLASTTEAQADGIRFRASADLGARAELSVGGASASLSASFGGALRVGAFFGSRPPAPPPLPVAVAVVQVAPQPVVVAPMPVYPVQPEYRRPIRRWALGGFAGSASTSGQEAGPDLGFVSQYRLSPHFVLEGELSEARLSGLDERRYGVGAQFHPLPRGAFSPYLLAATGLLHSQVSDRSTREEYGYGEVGAGLQYKLSPRIALLGELRAGRNWSLRENAGSSKGIAEQVEQESSRARLGAIFRF